MVWKIRLSHSATFWHTECYGKWNGRDVPWRVSTTVHRVSTIPRAQRLYDAALGHLRGIGFRVQQRAAVDDGVGIFKTHSAYLFALHSIIPHR